MLEAHLTCLLAFFHCIPEFWRVIKIRLMTYEGGFRRIHLSNHKGTLVEIKKESKVVFHQSVFFSTQSLKRA